MQELASFTQGTLEQKDQVILKLYRVGRDFLAVVYGGDAHIGAITSFSKQEEGSFQFEGHRDLDALKIVRSKLQKLAIKTNVALLGGIHYDDISKEVIERILRNVHHLGDDLLEFMNKL